jgi:5S rRNA maturation endonuclease (ribonuclease M5)
MNEEKRNKILNLIDKAKKEHLLFVVEGQKDKEALEKIGINNIFILKKGNFPGAIEKIINLKMKIKKCIILTDFDKEGKKLYYILKRELVENGIRIDDKLRRALMKEKLSHIEGLFNFLS